MLEGVGWVIFGIGGGFFLVTGLRTGDTFTIIMSAIVLLAVVGAVVVSLRRQNARVDGRDEAPADPND